MLTILVNCAETGCSPSRLAGRAGKLRRTGRAGTGEAWAPRIDHGVDTIDHALNGFSGRKGIMPKKGGRVDLSDEEIIGAVEYIVAQVAP